MREFRFILKLRLPRGLAGDHAVERLGAEGCTDALIGLGLAGRLALDFTREAKSAQLAIDSAVADVFSALPEADLCEIGPDLVGLSDAAEWLGLSRQAMRKAMLVGPDFPAPLHDGSTAIWHLADILDWFGARRGKVPNLHLAETALAAREANFQLEEKRLAARRLAARRLPA